MKRRQVFEIEDQDWCPRTLRDGLTDYLRFALDMVKPYNSIAPRLCEAIRRSGATQVVDLCSGGGGPWRTLLPALRASGCEVRVLLTDLYPNIVAFEAAQREADDAIHFVADSVDATRVDAGLGGFRTLFTGFHHFEPETAARILEDAVRSRTGIGVFEFLERRPHHLLGSVFIAPLMVWLTTPFVRPVRWSRFAWTYPVPVLPFVAAVDGTMSILRSYTPAELLQMTERLTDHEWNAGVQSVKGMPGGVTYLVGVPKR